MNINIVDYIVSIVLLTPLICAALWYHYRGSFTGAVADQTVRDLSERSRLEAKTSRRV